MDKSQQIAQMLLQGQVPIPQPKPSYEQMQANQEAQYRQTLDKLRTIQSAPPYGRSIYDNLDGSPGHEGPLNITPYPIYDPSSNGWIGAPYRK